jgi:hypothetical protein
MFARLLLKALFSFALPLNAIDIGLVTAGESILSNLSSSFVSAFSSIPLDQLCLFSLDCLSAADVQLQFARLFRLTNHSKTGKKPEHLLMNLESRL